MGVEVEPYTPTFFSSRVPSDSYQKGPGVEMMPEGVIAGVCEGGLFLDGSFAETKRGGDISTRRQGGRD